LCLFVLLFFLFSFCPLLFYFFFCLPCRGLALGSRAPQRWRWGQRRKP